MSIKHLNEKSTLYKQYITNNNLLDHFFDPTKKSTYNIDQYLSLYLLFNQTGISYDNFYLILHTVSLLGHTYPKKSALHTFKQKIAKLKIAENIMNNYVVEHDKISDVCIIDSSTITNKCNSTIASKFGYKGKKGIKIHQIVNDEPFPLVSSTTSCVVHDSNGAYDLIKNNIDMFRDKNITFYGDKGYDSSNLRNLIESIGCQCIIPKNIRKEDPPAIKQIKDDEKKKTKKVRFSLMKRQKKIRQHKQKIIKDQKRNKYDANIDDIINELDDQLKNIKNERSELAKKHKENITRKVQKEKQHKCTKRNNTRICIKCSNNSMCNECNVCFKCKKNLSYYRGIDDNDVKKYNKIRIRVEHYFSHFKHGRIAHVNDRKYNMLQDTIHCKQIDFIIRDKKDKYG